MGAFGNRAGFVGLDVADDVPVDVGAIGELFGFVLPFLDVVFAKMVLSVLVEFADGFGGKGFADGNELDAVFGALGLVFGGADLGENVLAVGF